MRSYICCAVALSLLGLPSVASAQDIGLVPPVDGAIGRHFDPPDGTFGPGHRGVDFTVPAGARVRAAGAGTVSFAGTVAGALAVSVRHGSGLSTTYSQLGEVWVDEGDAVASGTWLGLVGTAHDGVPGLHLGVKVDGVYVDPLSGMAPLDLGGALRLTPLLWEPSAAIPQPLADAMRPTGPGSNRRSCSAAEGRTSAVAPPNDNVVIAVAGIGSKTVGPDAADMYHPGPRFFGYEPNKTYLFSYRGAGGSRLHRDYERTDTYGDIEHAAARLGELVQAVGRKHPGADIDLIAHSQGGIVARTYLARRASGRFVGGPRVAHLVTLASPHTGAPAAANVEHLREETRSGPPLLALAVDRAAAQWPIPDPTSAAVTQLTPDSHLLDSLASQDVTFGTRVLTLGIPNDLVVPADRTSLPDSQHRIVPPMAAIRVVGGRPLPGNGHSAVVTSPVTRGYVHGFLSGRAEPCLTVWDGVGSTIGRAISAAEARLGAVVSHAEGLGGRVVRTLGEVADGGSGQR